MSAYKTAYIRLGEAEYKRLREAEEQLRMNHFELQKEFRFYPIQKLLGGNLVAKDGFHQHIQI